jgi:hypothetical protein
VNNDDNPLLTTPEDPHPASESKEEASADHERTGEEEEHTGEEDPSAGDSPSEPRPRPAYRTPVFAIARVVVVVAVAVVVYQAVVPSTDVIRARLSRLAVTEPGLKGFNARPVQANELPASQTGLKTLVAAAKQAPNQTGAYAVEWTQSQTPGAAVFAYLLPNTKQAAALVPEIRTGQMGASSFTADGLTRHATYTVKGFPDPPARCIPRPPKADQRRLSLSPRSSTGESWR